jgi:phage terminase large subunit-like protein
VGWHLAGRLAADSVTWDLSCPDWEAKLRAGKTPIPRLPLTPHGDRAVAVFDRLRLADVGGTPRLGPRQPEDPADEPDEAAGQWFRDIVRAVFGGWDPVARQRYIRELFALVPKKNSKTSYGALGLMLVALLLNERPRAQFLMTAPVQDTADMAFSAIAGAIALDPVLEAKLHVRDHLKEIVHRQTKAKLEIITFEPKVVTGKKVVGALIDELHVLGKMPRADKALIQLRGGMEPFPEAFLAFITTQSDEQPSGVFRDELIRARKIRDGQVTGQMLPVLYEFPESMQVDRDKPWRDPENWAMVTPNRGRSIDLGRLRERFKEEDEKGENALRVWASQHLNIEIGLALSSNGWAGASFWEAAAEPGLTLESLLERCEVAVVGIDGGGLDDLLGLAVLGREHETRRWLLWTRAWAHRIVLERRKDIASKLADLARQGDLVMVDQPGDDVVQVADIVSQVRDAGLLPEKNAIGVDAVGIGDIVDELMSPERGFIDGQIVAVSQGWRLNAAIKTAERKVAGGELVHGGQPLMAWCVGNAKAEARGNAILITKQASGSAKIDPLMATFDAVSLMAMNPPAMALGDGYSLMVV